MHCLESHLKSPAACLQVIYFWGGFACFVIYCFEFMVRMIADPIPYLKNPADQFDIFLTLLNAFDLFIAPRLGIDLGLSSLRMFRLFRLLTRIETFVGLLETIVKSAPQAMASVVLTFIVIFIFAAVGTRMFTWVKEGSELDTTFNNFSNFLKSLIAMFRVSSGANWSTVLAEAGIGAPYCTPQYWTPVDVNSTAYKGTSKAAKLDSFGTWTNGDVGFVSAGMVSDCGIGIGALAFFLIFVFINNYIILPTFVASIISSYYEANLKEHSLISKQVLVRIKRPPSRPSTSSIFPIPSSLHLVLSISNVYASFHPDFSGEKKKFCIAITFKSRFPCGQGSVFPAP